MTNKEIALRAVRELPEDATIAEIIDRIETLAAIREGQEDIEAGRFISHEELERRLDKWLSR